MIPSEKSKNILQFFQIVLYCAQQLNIEGLQGRVKFPIGGEKTVRERKLNRCESGTDSTVWMEEDAS